MQNPTPNPSRTLETGGWATRLAAIPSGRRLKWLILVIGIVLAAAVSPIAEKVGEVEENDAAAYLPRSSESLAIAELLPEFHGGESIPAVVVYVRESGISDDDRAAVEAHRQALASLVGDGQVPPAEASEDGNALLLTIPLPQDRANEDAIFEQIDEIRATVAEGRPQGLNAKVTGPAGLLVDSVSVFQELDTTLLLVTASVVAVLLLVIYRSPVLWLLPLIAVGVASQLANAVVYLLARYADLTVTGMSAGVLTVLVFGVATDYALLLVARYREELHQHEDRHIAMAVALRRAGPAILASASTSTIGLLCLLAAELNSTRGLGPVAAAGVVSALVAITLLLPALFVILGRWVFWPFVPRCGMPMPEGKSAWSRIASWVGRAPRAAWVSATILLAALSLGLLNLEAGLTAEEQFTTTPESVEGQLLIEAHFAAGSSSPAYVAANAAVEEAVTAAILATDGVAEVQPSLQADHPETGQPLTLIPAILADPPTSRAAEETIERLRDRVQAVPESGAIVGGDTAVALDTRVTARQDELVVIPLVLAVVFVILVLLLRAVVAPALLIVTNLLSFLAAVGGSILIFEWIFGIPALDPGILILGFVFLIALSIDYNIFLLTRVREEVEHIGHRRGVLRGLAVTGGVITSAGVVLAATFTVLSVFPIVFLLQFGVLVAFGVLLDTLVVRTVLVPALALELGTRTWWPSGLVRRLSGGQLDTVRADLTGIEAD